MADVDALIQDLKTGDYYSRSTAARALGQIGGEKAAAALIEALGDEDDWVQEYAADSLGKLAYEPAVEPLGKMLISENYKVRVAAAEALGKIGGDDARKLLEPLREDTDSWVRDAAISALKKMPEQEAYAQPEQPEPEIVYEPAPTSSEAVEKPDVPPAIVPAAQAPVTPEEIMELVTAGTRMKYKSTDSGFLLQTSVGGGRRQKVRLKFNATDEDGSLLIQIFTIIGPAKPEHYEWALKLNPGFSYGAIGLVSIDGKDFFAIMDTILEENVDIKGLRNSIWSIARRGDKLEKKLIQEDLW